MPMRLTEEVEKGIPELKYDMEHELRVYHEFRHSVYVVDRVLCDRERLIILKVLREGVLVATHAAYQEHEFLTAGSAHVGVWGDIAMYDSAGDDARNVRYSQGDD